MISDGPMTASRTMLIAPAVFHDSKGRTKPSSDTGQAVCDATLRAATGIFALHKKTGIALSHKPPEYFASCGRFFCQDGHFAFLLCCESQNTGLRDAAHRPGWQRLRYGRMSEPRWPTVCRRSSCVLFGS